MLSSKPPPSASKTSGNFIENKQNIILSAYLLNTLKVFWWRDDHTRGSQYRFYDESRHISVDCPIFEGLRTRNCKVIVGHISWTTQRIGGWDRVNSRHQRRNTIFEWYQTTNAHTSKKGSVIRLIKINDFFILSSLQGIINSSNFYPQFDRL